MANKDINIPLALAKQFYEELTHLASLVELERYEFGSGQKRERIEELLRKFSACFDYIQLVLSESVSGSEAPILGIPQAHRAFYNDVIVPHGKWLQRTYYEITDVGLLIDFWDEIAEHTHFREAMSWALEQADAKWERGQAVWQGHKLNRQIDIEGARKMVGKTWFQPDEWSKNEIFLHPILVDRPLQVMRDHVRYRLTEIYRAFTYGLWMATASLCRSLVEYTLKANAPRLNIPTTYEGADGRREDKSLKRLGNDVANAIPELEAPIEKVRETGNRILHPNKHDVISHPKVMRAEALECILATRLIVETLYSEILLKK